MPFPNEGLPQIKPEASVGRKREELHLSIGYHNSPLSIFAFEFKDNELHWLLQRLGSVPDLLPLTNDSAKWFRNLKFPMIKNLGTCFVNCIRQSIFLLTLWFNTQAK